MKAAVDYDFILSIVLFSIIYVYLFTFFPFLTTGAKDVSDELLTEANYLSEVIVKSPGYPKNWTNISEVELFGLAYYNQTYYPNLISIEKTKALNQTNCSELWSKQFTTVAYAVRVKTSSDEYSCIGDIPSSARKIERYACLKDNYSCIPCIMEVYSWLK